MKQLPLSNWIDRLPDQVRDTVRSRMAIRTVSSGEYIYKRGDNGNELFHLINGSVQASTTSWQGKELIYYTFQQGDSFGEISLLEGGKRPLDAIAKEKSQVAVLKKADLQTLQALYPQVTNEIEKLLCRRLRMVFTMVEESTLSSLPGSMANRLCDIATQFGYSKPDTTEIKLKLTQEKLAHMLGATRQGVNKTLKGWEAEGLIKISYGHIVLRDIDKLKVLAMEL